MSGFPLAVPPALIDLLRDHSRFLLATHEHPDNDGFGSMLAVGLALRAMGREVVMVHDGNGPENLGELPGFEQTTLAAELDFEAEAALVFDCHRLDRTGPVRAHLERVSRVAVIDHHPVGEEGCEGDVCWVVKEAAATAVLAHSLLLALDPGLVDADRATCLYAALVTDTGGFRFDNTTEGALLSAADLVARGVNAAAVAERFLYQRRPGALRLLGRVLEGADYRMGGRVGLLRVPRRLRRDLEVEISETEGFVNFLTSAEGVRLVAMLKEDEQDQWRVSLRANPPHRVDHIARALGGGGHARAAAFTSASSAEEIESALLGHFGAELERDRGRA